MMRRLSISFALFLLASQAIADEALRGINVVNPQWRSLESMAETIKALHANDVSAIRVPLKGDAKSKNFIKDAVTSGLDVLIIVDMNDRRSMRVDARMRSGKGRSWDMYPLTHVDIAKLKENFAQELAALESAGVRAIGFEVGNEINWTPFNGDFDIIGKGRVLGRVDLSRDPVGRTVARSFDHYLKIVRAVKEVRDQSRLNKQTPIISAGLSDIRPGRWLHRKRMDTVSLAATLGYLRDRGLDGLVDFYGIHKYANIWRSWEEQRAGWWEPVLKHCGSGSSKPCWVTEWGYANWKPTCSVDDTRRADLVRKTVEYLAKHKAQVPRAFYYSWSTHPFEKGKPVWHGVFRCGMLMDAGEALLERKAQ